MWRKAGGFMQCANPGDLVEESIVYAFRDCIYPAYHTEELIQCGDEYTNLWHVKNQQYLPIYFTFSKTNDNWIYCGICLLGETKDMSAFFQSRSITDDENL